MGTHTFKGLMADDDPQWNQTFVTVGKTLSFGGAKTEEAATPEKKTRKKKVKSEEVEGTAKKSGLFKKAPADHPIYQGGSFVQTTPQEAKEQTVTPRPKKSDPAKPKVSESSDSAAEQ